MKKNFLVASMFCLFFGSSTAQSPVQSYLDFRAANANLTYHGLSKLYALPSDAYYKGYNFTPPFNEVLYLDTVSQKLGMTLAEQERLNDNHFFVTERLTANTFANAFHQVYAKDLPVFVSTDAILHALHRSYSYMLKTIEGIILIGNLEALLKSMYDDFPALAAANANKGIDKSLADIDLYLSVAYALITDKPQQVRLATNESYQKVMDAIGKETIEMIPLFCDEPQFRTIDFSQFKVRGHYVYTEEDKIMGHKSLEPYFKAMMWLGRIDFFLSPPANTPWTKPWERDEVRRLNIDAFLLNQLLYSSKHKKLYDQNEEIINYFVGISDNVTPVQYNAYLSTKQLNSADQLLNDTIFDNYLEGLVTHEQFKQRIIGEALFADPLALDPDILPISFKLSGQRFIIDSEVLSNVVFDRIIFEEKKVMRMMPKTLDILFALGNNNAAYLLEDELKKYDYAPNLANMRYLIDTKDDAFWNASLYNTWLGAIRDLNPSANNEKHPFFMQTAAWHHQKMNTQLGSWAQLRHNNLLYAKPSYTMMLGCSYPYSYIEPYPKFYKRLADFTNNAGNFIGKFSAASNISSFFKSFSGIMAKLEVLAEKELVGDAFTVEEEEWLRSMLYKPEEDCAPAYSGWYTDLYFSIDDMTKPDYITVDIHTQPTDEAGTSVGNVLHAGLGKINLGVFLIPKPGTKNNYIAYTGPFYSYYEEITNNFHRMTDQEWEAKVGAGQLPERPEWTATFLLNNEGLPYNETKALPSVYLVGLSNIENNNNLARVEAYPVPCSNYLNIHHLFPAEHITSYTLTDITGRVVQKARLHSAQTVIDVSRLNKGIYLMRIESNGKSNVVRVAKE
jgi:hypothetical protein